MIKKPFSPCIAKADAFEQALALIACPACLKPLRNNPASLACTGCGRVYPVVDGIPILLVDRATVPV